jgi:hypothetical protein
MPAATSRLTPKWPWPMIRERERSILASTDSAPAEPTRVTVIWSPPKDSRPVFTNIPNRRANDDKGSRPATNLTGTRERWARPPVRQKLRS